MSRTAGRSQRCSQRDAQTRYGHAVKFLEVAEIAAGEPGHDPEYASVAVSLAVLAGIAAADAACCHALGERSRSQDHDDAKEFLRRVPGGDAVVRQLASLLNLKDEAHYGFHNVSTPELKQALRRARALTKFSAGVLGRPAAR